MTLLLIAKAINIKIFNLLKSAFSVKKTLTYLNGLVLLFQ